MASPRLLLSPISYLLSTNSSSSFTIASPGSTAAEAPAPPLSFIKKNDTKL